MKVGFSSKFIDLKLPCQLGGYGVKRIANKYNNDLYVKCITFEIDNVLQHILFADILAWDEAICKTIADNFPDEKFIFTATHTHSGPAGLWKLENTVLNGCEYFLGKVSDSNIRSLESACIHSIVESKSKLSKFNYNVSKSTIQGVATNRNRQNLETEQDCLLIDFELSSGEKICIIYYTCHPTVLGGNSMKLSADLFGGIREKVQEDSGYNWVGIMNGPAGDVSTRYTKKTGTDEEIDRLSDLFISQMPKTRGRLKSMNDMRCFSSSISIEIKKPKDGTMIKQSMEEVLRQLEITTSRELQMKYASLEADKAYIKAYLDIESISIPISYLKIDDLIFVFLPVEIASELTVNDFSKQNNIKYISYSNGYMMYLSSKKSYDLNEYESSNTSFERGGGEKVIRHIEKFIKEVIYN